MNDQNVEGTKKFLQEVGIDKRREDLAEKWDEADVLPTAKEAPGRLGPKPTLLVASPVPAGEIQWKQQRLGALEKAIGPATAKLSYHPQMALLETIFVRERACRSEYLAREYTELADQLMAAVSDQPSQLLQYDWFSKPPSARP